MIKKELDPRADAALSYVTPPDKNTIVQKPGGTTPQQNSQQSTAISQSA